jgi:hypothetical protein
MNIKRTAKQCLYCGIATVAMIVVDSWVLGSVIIPKAEARVGRPMTPTSVAGVARRTTRRTIRRTSVVVATLPKNCTTIVIEDTTLQQCGGTYYQPQGSQYVVVNVD